MHILRRLRRDQARQRLPELWRRVRGAADQAIPGVATRGMRFEQLPSEKRVHLKYSLDEIEAHVARIREIPPQER